MTNEQAEAVRAPKGLEAERASNGGEDAATEDAAPDPGTPDETTEPDAAPAARAASPKKRWGKQSVFVAWGLAAVGGAAAMAGWHHYGHALRARFAAREVELTVIASDAQNLACASDLVVGGLRCGYQAGEKPWPAPAASSSPPTLQPYTTTDNKRLLGAGLWADAALASATLPKSRFNVRCKFVQDGSVDTPSVRWAMGGKFMEGGGTWPAGTLSDCAVVP